MAHLAHYREAHPLPFVITHWINLVCMFTLIITGFCIHFPYFPYFMSIARGIHVFCGFVIFINCIVRIILAFVVDASPAGGSRQKIKDFHMWLPQKDNRHQALEWVKYYLFLRKTHPLGGKLGVPQKLSYLAIAPLIIIMFITGICLWPPLASTAFCKACLGLVGGAMSMRIIHFFLMFVFIIFCFIHLYLANVEGTEPTKLMLFRKEHGGLTYDIYKHNIVGEDNMGHEEAAEATETEEVAEAEE